VTGDHFRQVMGHFATGIVVATTRDPDGAPAGLTCNSVTSVSLDPPLVLFCVDRDSKTLPAFLQARAFALSILRETDEAVSRRFATGEPTTRFVDTPTWTAETGMPILSSALAWLDCDLHETVEAGDHRILLGRVRASGVSASPGAVQPLLYFRGKYRTLSP
jgi:flavin reductase (DIM6/NTAB) family NADH-FMN oxidoreductase RutF